MAQVAPPESERATPLRRVFDAVVEAVDPFVEDARLTA
jgi:hypothetical protein